MRFENIHRNTFAIMKKNVKQHNYFVGGVVLSLRSCKHCKNQFLICIRTILVFNSVRTYFYIRLVVYTIPVRKVGSVYASLPTDTGGVTVATASSQKSRNSAIRSTRATSILGICTSTVA